MVSGPLVFVAVGLAIGPLGLGLVEEDGGLEPVRVLLESAPAVVLFTDAAARTVSVRLGVARTLPSADCAVLRVVGLPLTPARGPGDGRDVTAETPGVPAAAAAGGACARCRFR
jgi:hypothetical protein